MALTPASILLGTAPNDGTGDSLRVGGSKINSNFSAIQAEATSLGNADLDHGSVSGNTMTLYLKGGGSVAIDVTALAADVHITGGSYNAGTSSIDFTTNTGTGGFSVPVSSLLPVSVTMSITGNGAGSALQLAGDSATPGNGKVYSTDPSTGAKGWRSLSSDMLPSNIALLGVPTAPTASPGANSAQVATTAYVDTASLVAYTRSGTSYTLLNSDNGTLLKFTNASNITVTVPNTLPEDFRCECKQMGTGVITFSPSAGATNVTPGGSNKSPWQYGTVIVEVAANSNGTTAMYLLGNAST